MLDPGHQAQVAGRLVRGGKAIDVSQSRHQRLGDGAIDAGQGHQELNPRISKCLTIDHMFYGFDFDLQRGEQPEVGVDGCSGGGIERDRAQPREPLHRERIRGGFGDQPLRQHRVDTVADRRAVVHQGGPPAASPRLCSTAGPGCQTEGR